MVKLQSDPLTREMARYDPPDRTWSGDSHLLPAGIRHVPRRDIPPLVRSEEPPVRPWEQGETPRERPPQRVRFEDSYDDYGTYVRPPPPPPPPRHAQYSYDSYDAGPVRPLRTAGPSLNERIARERELLEREQLERARRELEILRVREKNEREARRARVAREDYPREIERERRSSPPSRPATRAGARRSSPSPPLVTRRRRLSSEDEDDKKGRRTRSSSPPDRFIKAELYSDPESYEHKPGRAGRYADSENDGYGPAIGTAALAGEAQDYAWQDVSAPAPRVDSEDDESEASWNSSSDTSPSELYDLFNERKIYEFNPSHLSRKPSQDASTTLSGSLGDVSTAAGSGSGGKGTRAPSPDPSLGPKAVRPYRIYQSEYTGDGFPEGSHSVRLTAVLDSKTQRQPLFKWRYCHSAFSSTRQGWLLIEPKTHPANDYEFR